MYFNNYSNYLGHYRGVGHYRGKKGHYRGKRVTMEEILRSNEVNRVTMVEFFLHHSGPISLSSQQKFMSCVCVAAYESHLFPLHWWI